MEASWSPKKAPIGPFFGDQVHDPKNGQKWQFLEVEERASGMELGHF